MKRIVWVLALGACSYPVETDHASAAGDCVDAVRLASCAADGTLSDLLECQAVWACP